ncbi:MAG TPA: helix-turn-helix domain-containing protein [Myxococcota bacterium]|nr:helix-turn-helix domain-containing protein [Myxococcota bacterium]
MAEKKKSDGDKTAKKKSTDQDADPKQKPLVTLAEVASMLRLPLLRIRKMVQAGQIPGVKVDGEWRFNKDLVVQAIKRRSRGR